MRRLLTLLMMLTLTIVSGTSIAAAMCHHQDAQAHAAALRGSDKGDAAAAQLEETAASVASKRGALADVGSFSLPAFILPDAFAAPIFLAAPPPRPRPSDEAKIAGLSIPPPLQPPSA